MIHHLATAFVDFLVAIFALSSKHSPASRPMALVAVSMGLWSIELYILSSGVDPLYLDTLFHVTRWGMFLIPPSLILLTWSLIGRNSETFFYGAVVPGFVFGVGLCITNYFFLPSILEPVTGGYQPKPDLIYSMFSLSFIAALVTCIGLGVKRFRKATFRETQKIKWLLIVLVMTLALGVLSMMLIHYPFYLKLVGASINMVFIGLLFYAAVQHHLMDVKLALGVGLVKVTAVAAIIWLYFFIGNLIDSPVDPVSHIIIMVIFVYIALELYPVYQEWALSKTKTLVSRSTYDVKRIKQHVRLMLDASFDWETFRQVLDYLFVENMAVAKFSFVTLASSDKSSHQQLEVGNCSVRFPDCTFLKELSHICLLNKGIVLTDECDDVYRNYLERDGFTAFFGVFNDDSLVGVVLLGKNKGNKNFRYEDMIVIDWLADALGPNVDRLQRVGVVYQDLSDAKKTLSLLGMMNQYHHDIKAPLSIIDGVLSNDLYEGEKQKSIVLEQVARMTKLVATMSSVFQDRRERKEKPVSLTDLVKACVLMFEKQIRHVAFHLEDLQLINGDEDDLTILFINIVKNAIEAGGDRGVDLDIRSWVEGDYSCISISDNGVGMPASRVKEIFEKPDSTKPQGSGIGMQAIKRIADEHHAIIDIASKVGEGSTITLKFPYKVSLRTVDKRQGPSTLAS